MLKIKSPLWIIMLHWFQLNSIKLNKCTNPWPKMWGKCNYSKGLCHSEYKKGAFKYTQYSMPEECLQNEVMGMSSIRTSVWFEDCPQSSKLYASEFITMLQFFIVLGYFKNTLDLSWSLVDTITLPLRENETICTASHLISLWGKQMINWCSKCQGNPVTGWLSYARWVHL